MHEGLYCFTAAAVNSARRLDRCETDQPSMFRVGERGWESTNPTLGGRACEKEGWSYYAPALLLPSRLLSRFLVYYKCSIGLPFSLLGGIWHYL